MFEVKKITVKGLECWAVYLNNKQIGGTQASERMAQTKRLVYQQFLQGVKK